MASWPLLIELDREGRELLYLQIVRAVGEGVRKGRLKPGDPLPGTRALAETLGVNRTTTSSGLNPAAGIGFPPSSGTMIGSARSS